MTYLLDTVVVSAMRDPKRLDDPVAAILSSLAETDCWLSVISLLEIEKGIRLVERRDAAQAAILRRWFASVERTFADRLLTVSRDIALRCAALHVPNPRPPHDALLAATALVHDLTLVTRNVRDFAGIDGLRILDPWN